MSFTVKRTLNLTKYYPQIGLYVESGTEDLTLTYAVSSVANINVPDKQATVFYSITDSDGHSLDSLAFTFGYEDISSIITEAEEAMKAGITS